ncbi:MAG: DUF192 domain-containing protein [Dehalococcoidia bacterium]
MADRWLLRLRGLLGVRNIGHPDGLLIPHCSSVHSIGMTVTIDLVYLNDEFEVTKVVSRLKPWRVSFGGRRTSQTLELPEGTVERLGLQPGQQLEVSPSTDDVQLSTP